MYIYSAIKKMIGTAAVLVVVMCPVYAAGKQVFFYGSVNNDLYKLLIREGFTVKQFSSPGAAVNAAPNGAGVFLVAKTYPEPDSNNVITEQLLGNARKKNLRLYIEYPAAFPGLSIPGKALETNLERAVITTDSFDAPLKKMNILGIHNCFVLPVQVDNPLMVLAKVVGVDRAEYGLTDTKSYPLLFEKDGAWISMTGLSNFETGRYGPDASIRVLWATIIARITNMPKLPLHHWIMDVAPAYARSQSLPGTARINAVRKGVQWFNNGHFFVHPAWKAEWEKYGNNGTRPIGPPLDPVNPNGDGTLGIIEGHTSTIYFDGRQQYRYWMRSDVQGETSMALAAAGSLLNNEGYKRKAANLLDFMFRTSNLRAGAKRDSASAAYGLLGWATSNAATFYGDDNSRAILGAIAASAYLKTDRWDKEIATAIMGNFRTTGIQGFRGERLEEADIIKNGWPFYYNRKLVHPSPHFESWMWACYLWLYNKTHYEPLLARVKTAIKLTMEAYPDKWRWGSSMQTQRARMILPLAWLLRIENTPEHHRWLDLVATDMLTNQVESGAIREELGKGKGMFNELKKNADYGSDEGSLIFKNGEEISCMLYTNNFAAFSLNEAAAATGDGKYRTAANKLSDFLVRIQVHSKKHPDLDGAWFRAFDYGKWDYWASNSDAGWGAWCTLTGWIQSWIVTTEAQIVQKQNFWDLTKGSRISVTAGPVIHQMMTTDK